jgi:AcrR family transcriptional regulator
MIEADATSGKSVKKRCGAGRPAACEVAGRLEHLLDTATDAFLECGYKGANVSEIARRAGASKRTIYARYPSKAELFIAVATRKMDEMQTVYAKTLAPDQPLSRVLDEFGSILLRSMLRPDLRSLFQVIVAESPEFPKLAETFWELGPKRLTNTLEVYLATHAEFRGERPDHAAEMFCSMCWGMAILKKQFYKDYQMPLETRLLNVKEAVRIFQAAYTESPAAILNNSPKKH